jgi:hypothetical protein
MKSGFINANRVAIAALLWLLGHAVAWGAQGFATQRLGQMAASLTDIPFKSLSQGTHHEFSYANHPLTIRVNAWDEVEHIGYLLFDSLTVQTQSSVVCDFVERYLLELDLGTQMDRKMRMGVDKVVLERGNLDNVHVLRPDDRLEISMVEMLRYRFAWFRGEECLLSLVFNMDYQLLSGCNAIELEQNYLRDLKRKHGNNPLWEDAVVEDGDDEFAIVDGGNYLSESIRADRYYRRDAMSGWKLVCGGDKPYWSAANLMLSPSALGDFQLDCKLDMYGYHDSSFGMAVNQWVAQTLAEGCKLFFGVKSRTLKTIQGTLFCPNYAGGYCHMMRVDIPVEAFDSGKGTVKGRLYVYVPLHNIDSGYFDLDYVKVSNAQKP